MSPSPARHPSSVCDVVVIGAGIAGLTAAWRLRHRDVLVLEAADRVGGRMRSEPHGEYWMNYGAHLMPAPGSLVDSLAVELGLESVPVWGSMMGMAIGDTKLTSGPVESYPFRLPIPWRDRAIFASKGLRLQRAVRARRQHEDVRSDDTSRDRRARILGFEDDRTFEQFLGSMPSSVEQIFACAARRSTADLEDLSAGCGIGLFALVWGGKGSLIARNLLGGTGRLPEALARRLGDRVRVSAPAVDIEPMGGDLVVTYDDGGRTTAVRARHVIVAAQAPFASELIADVAPAAAKALARLRYGAFLAVAIATNETGPMPWDRTYAMATPGRVFDMFTNQAHAMRERSGPRRPGGSLMLFSGGAAAAQLSELSNDAIVGRFLDDLVALFPEAGSVVEEARVHRWPLGNVFAQPGRRRLQDPIEGALGTGHNLHLAGDYFAELGNLEAAARTGAEAAARVDGLLDAATPNHHPAQRQQGAHR